MFFSFPVAHLLRPRSQTSKLEKSLLLRATRILTLSSWRMLEDAGRALPPADGSLLVSTNPMLTRALCIHSKMQNMHNIFNFEILLLPVSSSMIPSSTVNFVHGEQTHSALKLCADKGTPVPPKLDDFLENLKRGVISDTKYPKGVPKVECIYAGLPNVIYFCSSHGKHREFTWKGIVKEWLALDGCSSLAAWC